MPRPLALVALLLLASSLSANPVVEENKRPGTTQWRSSRSADIEGYVSTTSAVAGQTISIYVSTADPTYTIEFFRMGWYQGLGGRRMTQVVELPARKQDACPMEEATGRIACNWKDPFKVTIPHEWLSGVYLGKITARPSGRDNWVMFVVRDRRRAELVFQNSITTTQAYNNWGGKSLYPFNSTGAPAKEVSFDRPYSRQTGPAEFLLQWEYNMVRFLEREGYDVTYVTNIDTHVHPLTIRRGGAFLSVGHDEYWSWEMRENVERARDLGIHLAFFSANTCYWQIRLEDNFRTMVSHKETALSTDPVVRDGDPMNDHLATTRWRDVPVSRPEESLLGVMYTISPVDADMTVENTSHWVFANTGLKDGDKIAGILGYEVDRIFGLASPPNLVRLAHSSFTNKEGKPDTSDMTIYETAQGSMVFATGTIQWSWGLDDYNASARGNRDSDAVKQITRNVLDRMIADPPHAKRRSVRR